LLKGIRVFKKFNTIDTSQVTKYLGLAGLCMKTLFINLDIKTGLLHQELPKKGNVCNKVDLCVLITEYDLFNLTSSYK